MHHNLNEAKQDLPWPVCDKFLVLEVFQRPWPSLGVFHALFSEQELAKFSKNWRYSTFISNELCELRLYRPAR